MPEAVYAGLAAGGWHSLTFDLFRDGVEVHWLVRGREGEPSAALLKYQAGASVPRHHHAGLETILVLDGSQSDENGTYEAGTMVFSAAGSEHSVWSEQGCVVFIHWDRPVVFDGGET